MESKCVYFRFFVNLKRFLFPNKIDSGVSMRIDAYRCVLMRNNAYQCVSMRIKADQFNTGSPELTGRFL
jgi:hypothetical protein